MKKITKKLLTVLVIFQLFIVQVFADTWFEEPSERIVVNGKVVESIYQNGITLVGIREVCDIFGSSITWNASNGEITIKNSNNDLYRPLYILHENKAFVNLNSINNMFSITSSHLEEYNVTALSSSSSASSLSNVRDVIPTYNGYTSEDLIWLSKIVHAEANGEDYPSKLAVASVILNRVDDGSYPDSIYEVIFDNTHGVQFTPTSNGSIYNTPSTESFLAALETLEGKRIKENALFFINPKTASSSWVSRNRDFAFTSGNHNFYY